MTKSTPKTAFMKKRIAVEVGIFVGVLAVIAGAMYGIKSWYTSVDQQRNTLRSELSAAESRISEITRQIDDSGTSSEIFNDIRSKKDNLSFTFERDQVAERLAVLRDKYRLSSLSLTVSPESEINIPRLQNMSMKAVYTVIDLKFGAMSDTHVFSFIDDLQRSMPGFVRVDDITIEREKAMDVTIFRQMSRGAVPQMISGSLSFKWIGLRPLTVPNTEAGAMPIGGMP